MIYPIFGLNFASVFRNTRRKIKDNNGANTRVPIKDERK